VGSTPTQSISYYEETTALDQAHYRSLSEKLEDTRFRTLYIGHSKKTVLGTIGCSGIYYDLRTGKQYVEVYYLTCIKEIGEILNAV
jgi:hypothetical protein